MKNRNNSYLRMKQYFADLVKRHTKIQGFSGYFNRELHHQMAGASGIASPYLALFRYEIGLEGGKENTLAVRRLGFAVMLTGVPMDDFEAQYAAIDRAEQLALSVFARIRRDHYDTGHFLYHSLIKESIQILPIELSQQAFGVECFFSLKNPQIFS